MNRSPRIALFASVALGARMGALGLALGLTGVASAQEIAPQYRLFTLSDGRELSAQVLATEAAGMRIAVPQGEARIPFLLLVDMAPIDEAAYLAQDDWLVWLVAPEAHEAPLAAALDAVDHVSVLDAGTAATALDPDTVARAEACGDNVDCLTEALADAPWLWIVTAQEADGQIALSGRISTGPTETAATYGTGDLAGLQSATHAVLDVTPDPDLPELSGPAFAGMAAVADAGKERTRTPREPVSQDKLRAAAFAPVPGLPALMKRDYEAFGLTMATVVPSTALWIGATGKSAQSVPEHALLGLGGFYAFTVVANQVFGLRGGDTGVAVGVGPTEGGAAVTVGGSIR